MELYCAWYACFFEQSNQSQQKSMLTIFYLCYWLKVLLIIRWLPVYQANLIQIERIKKIVSQKQVIRLTA